MTEPPTFLRPYVAAAFQDQEVSASYGLRPSYPPQVFDILLGLIADEAPAVLDLGCGTGFVARPLASLVDRVDAVDVSTAMIEEGKRLPGGDHPHLRWIAGSAEDVELQPPYALATAGDSLHWMDWDVVLPRLAGALSPNASLAILSVDGYLTFEDEALREGVVALIRRYSTLREWRPDFDLIAELTTGGLFEERGRVETAPVPFRQSISDYVESFHARASLARRRMEPGEAAAFDAALTELLRTRVGDTVELAVRGRVVWGRPLRG